MKKKYLFSILTMTSAVLLTSCATQVPELSKFDNDKAAEYMAGEMLKYDTKYAYALDYDRSVLEVTPTPAPTKAPTVTPKPVSDPAQQDPSATGGAGGEETPAMQEVSIAEVFGMSGIEITYVSTALKDSYGKGYESIVASKGKKLLIITFRIKNTGDAPQTLNLFGSDTDYVLYQGEQKKAPLRTSAAGDLQYFNAELSAGKSKQGCLMFEVDQNTKTEENSLQITNGTKQATITLS